MVDRHSCRTANSRALLSAVVTSLALLGLTACDTWLGADEELLPGDRISVLEHGRTLTPDPNLADRQVLLPPVVANAAWPQEGGVPSHVLHHVALSGLNPVWRVSIGSGANSEEGLTALPVSGDGLVFTLDSESTVSAFALDTGRKVWQRALAPEEEDGDGHFGGGLAYDGGVLYVTTPYALAFALDGASGEIIWQQGVPGIVRMAPTVADGRVFISTLENQLLAFNTVNGTPLWGHSGVPELASVLGGAAPTVESSVVLAAYSSGELTALRTDNGRPLWSENFAAQRRVGQVANLADIRGRPAISRGQVIAVGQSGLMGAVDLRSGRRLWESQIGSLESPWVAGDYAYVLTVDNELLCVTLDRGAIRWLVPLPQYTNPEDHIGVILWSAPILAGGQLLLAGSTGELLRVSPLDGEILGTVKLADATHLAPIVVNGTLLVLSDNGTLTAYR